MSINFTDDFATADNAATVLTARAQARRAAKNLARLAFYSRQFAYGVTLPVEDFDTAKNERVIARLVRAAYKAVSYGTPFADAELIVRTIADADLNDLIAQAAEARAIREAAAAFAAANDAALADLDFDADDVSNYDDFDA